MLKHRKVVSIIATIAFCLSFLAPAIIAPAPALAADMYQVVKSATVNPSYDSGLEHDYQDTRAAIKVVIPDIEVASGSRVTVSLPSEWDVRNVQATTGELLGDSGCIAVAGGSSVSEEDDSKIAKDSIQVGSLSRNKSFSIQLTPATDETGANKYFYIYFNGIDLNNMTGDLNVTFLAPAGSVFQTAQVNIGKSSRSGSTLTTIKKLNDITSEGGPIDIITISEMQAGTIEAGGTITLRLLTKGVTWEQAGLASYGWDFDGIINPGTEYANIDAFTAANTTISSNKKELKYTIPNSITADEPGQISFVDLAVAIDDEDAKAGDTIQVKLSGAEMTSITLDVGTYVDYGITVEEGTGTEIIAGKGDQEVGTFTIKEAARGTLVEGRTIKVVLPSGVKWHDATSGEMETTNNSDLEIANPDNVTGSDDHILLFKVDDSSSDNGGVAEFKDFTVDVAPDFVGPVEVTISGSAGVEATVKIAEVKPAVSISVETIKDVNLGQANQALGDITLTEGIAEGLEEGDLVLVLDDSYRWADEPTVKVTEGDLDIDDDVDVDDNELTIKVKSTSVTASTIVISDVYVDAYRNAPEGAINLKIASYEDGCEAILDVEDINEGYVDEWEDLIGGKAQVANCVTPAAVGGRNVTLYIGSTIMTVNGASIIMDAAPYIKAGRTYVPVRYLGEGLAANVEWDEATKTVTITKDDKTVVLVIGSTIAKVNGADVQMDVAPEITGVGRTMLPARWVAEGLGYAVGWNEVLKQVVIQ